MPSRKSKRSSRHDDEEIDKGFEQDYNVDVDVEHDDDDDNDEENNSENENNDHEAEEEERRIKSNSHKRHKRVKVMSESGQTESQRRKLRHHQRKLFSKMTDSSLDVGDKMADVNSDTLQKLRKENNHLWNEVRFTREAVLDGDNIDYISSKAARQLDQLISVPRYDADRLASKIRSKCSIHTNSTSIFDWKSFGIEVGSCFNATPSYCSFLNGPIDSEYQPKERKKPVRRIIEEEDVKEEEVETVNQKSKNKDENKLSAVEKQLKVLNKTLKIRDEQEKEKVHDLAVEYFGKDIEDMNDDEKKRFMKRVKKSSAIRPCAIQFVMNPDSFTQTVENIFGLSFMVKKGDAEVGVRSYEDCKDADFGTAPGPWVKKVKFDASKSQPPAKQAIVSFTMQDWRSLKEAYDVVEGDIPHRGKSK